MKASDTLGLDLAPGGIASAAELPEKLYFRIGEVSKLTSLKPHVLRYWETEFPSIAPKKMGSNHRMYRRKDVELILAIKDLLYNKRFTIEGARKHLEAAKAKGPVATAKAGSRRTAPAAAATGGAITGAWGASSRATVSNLPMPQVQTSLFGMDEEAPPLPARSAVMVVKERPKMAAGKVRKELETILEILRD